MAIVNFKKLFTSGFDEDVLTMTAAGEHVLNYGLLTTTGDLADGIFAGADDVSIRNFSRIETSGLGAAGIFALGVDARIENYGTVVTHGGPFDPDPTIDDDESFSENIVAIGNRFHIANYGSVRVEGESSSGLSGVGADGTIINYGHLDSVSFNSSVLAVFGDGAQGINAGLMTIGGSDNAGMFALGEGASGLNLGRIVVNGTGTIGMQGVLENAQMTNRGVIIVRADESFGMAGFGNNQEVSNFGLIETHGTLAIGIAARGGGPFQLPGLDSDILNAGRIATEGDIAFGIAIGVDRSGFIAAGDDEGVNRGTIETHGDGAAGVVMIGDGHRLINSGRITTDGGAFDSDIIGTMRAVGVVVSGDAALLENTRSGVIKSEDAGSAAVELNVMEQDGLPAADMSSRLENFGLINGTAVAVLGGAGHETVINHGRIMGDVVLGDGADTFVFGKNGTLASVLFLGGDDDLVLIENGSGRAAIADFAAGTSGGDVIDVSQFFSSFGELTAHSRQRGDDVVVTLDHNARLVLEHVQFSALNAGDFLFV